MCFSGNQTLKIGTRGETLLNKKRLLLYFNCMYLHVLACTWIAIKPRGNDIAQLRRGKPWSTDRQIVSGADRACGGRPVLQWEPTKYLFVLLASTIQISIYTLMLYHANMLICTLVLTIHTCTSKKLNFWWKDILVSKAKNPPCLSFKCCVWSMR